MWLRFLGFPETVDWKPIDYTDISGWGRVCKGDLLNVESDLSEFLLASKNFEPATDADVQAHFAALAVQIEADQATAEAAAVAAQAALQPDVSALPAGDSGQAPAAPVSPAASIAPVQSPPTSPAPAATSDPSTPIADSPSAQE